MNLTIERKSPPKINSINSIELIPPAENHLDNDIPVFLIDYGNQDLIKIELIFKAGSWYQEDAITAFVTNKMLAEGTQNYSSNEIADKIDYFGSYVETSIDKDMAYVSLYSLNKHLGQMIPLLEEIVKRPLFPENELSIFLDKNKQEHIINSEKVHFLARTNFNELIFSEKHPYGKVKSIEDYDNISREQIIEFHSRYYSSNNCKIVVSGKIDDDCIEKLNNSFGDNNWEQKKSLRDSFCDSIKNTNNHKNFIQKDNALQSAIRIGRPLFNLKHPDFKGLQVLNTVLGGYFGSRLMTNIREDKGYAYGIGSAIVTMQNSGCFFISSEVGTEVTELAIEEIYKEIRKLRTELVSEDELSKVRNYMLGSFIRSFDGPFAIAEKFKTIMLFDLSYIYYKKLLDVINNIHPEEIRALAQTYLKDEDLYQLIVGSKK